MANAKRKMLSLKEKVAIIRKIESGIKQSTIVNQKSIPSSVISRIWKQRLFILESYASRPSKTLKVKTSTHKALDERLLLWFKEVREADIPISSPILMKKANEIAVSLGTAGFNCTNGWISRFLLRNEITFGKVCGESKSANAAVVEKWIAEVWPTISSGYKLEDIFNTDETGLYYKCTPDKTLRFKREACKGRKMSKERLTVLLCASITGEKCIPW